MPVSSTGLTIPTLQELIEDTVSQQRETMDPNLDGDTEEPVGQLNGIYLPKLRELYEDVQQLATVLDLSNSEGLRLDTTGNLTGTRRRGAQYSYSDLVLTLDANTTVNEGSIVTHEDDSTVRFISQANIVSTTAGNYTGRFVCDTPGVISAVAGKLTTIATPVTGWTSVTNPLDAVLGRLQETDTEYKIRIELSRQRVGSATPGGITSDVLAEDDAVSVQVFENDTHLIDSDGRPAWSVEVVVWDGTAAGSALSADTVAQAIYDTRGAATRTFGNTSGLATKLDGTQKRIYFSRPVQRNVYIELSTDGGDPDLIKAAMVLVAHGPNGKQLPGVDVIALRYEATPLSVEGCENVSGFTLGFSASPVDTADLAIGVREIASLDTSRITIN